MQYPSAYQWSQPPMLGGYGQSYCGYGGPNTGMPNSAFPQAPHPPAWNVPTPPRLTPPTMPMAPPTRVKYTGVARNHPAPQCMQQTHHMHTKLFMFWLTIYLGTMSSSLAGCAWLFMGSWCRNIVILTASVQNSVLKGKAHMYVYKCLLIWVIPS